MAGCRSAARASREDLARLRAAFEAAGRDPDTLHVVPMGVQPSEEKLDHYRELGVTEAVLRLPSAAREEVLPTLDGFARYLQA